MVEAVSWSLWTGKKCWGSLVHAARLNSHCCHDCTGCTNLSCKIWHMQKSWRRSILGFSCNESVRVILTWFTLRLLLKPVVIFMKVTLWHMFQFILLHLPVSTQSELEKAMKFIWKLDQILRLKPQASSRRFFKWIMEDQQRNHDVAFK